MLDGVPDGWASSLAPEDFPSFTELVVPEVSSFPVLSVSFWVISAVSMSLKLRRRLCGFRFRRDCRRAMADAVSYGDVGRGVGVSEVDGPPVGPSTLPTQRRVQRNLLVPGYEHLHQPPLVILIKSKIRKKN